jgi:hypothetical protein
MEHTMTEERTVDIGDVYLDADGWMRVCVSAAVGVDHRSEKRIGMWAYLNANSLCLSGTPVLLLDMKPEKDSKFVLNLRDLAKDILKKE